MAGQTHFGVWKSLVSFPEGGDVLDLVGHLEDQERKYLNYIPDFEARMRFLALVCPANLASMVDGVIEEYCDGFSLEQHRVFESRHPGGDVFDNDLGGYVFTTPLRRVSTRVLDPGVRPDYQVAKALVLRAIMGADVDNLIEAKLKKGQGTTSVEVYIAAFRRLMKVVQGVQGGQDETRYARLFIKGLSEGIRFQVVVPDGRFALEGAYKAARAAASRSSLLGTSVRNVFQVHPSRQAAIHGASSRPSSHSVALTPLFEDQLVASQAAGPDVRGLVGALNVVSSPVEYLRMVCNMSGTVLSETMSLTASAQSLVPLHFGLKTALANATTSEELKAVIPLLVPRQFLAQKPKSSVGTKNVGFASENLNAVSAVAAKDEELKRLRTEVRSLKQQNHQQKHSSSEMATVVDLLSKIDSRREREYQSGWKRDREERERDGDRGNKWQKRDGGVTCFSCGEAGHVRADCTKQVRVVRCIWCKATDHEVDTCQKRIDSTCKQCGEKGHSAGFHKVRLCYKCNQEHSGLNGCRG